MPSLLLAATTGREVALTAAGRGTLRLPTFEAAGIRLYRRLTLIAQRGRVVKVFYPVFPPDRNAADVVAGLTRRTSGRGGGAPGRGPEGGRSR